MHDPEVYSDPESFNPERFLRRNTDTDELVFELDPTVFDPMNVAFGFGRRICPGRYYAYEVAWIVIAQILSVFSIEPKKDAQGKPILPPIEYKFAAVWCDSLVYFVKAVCLTWFVATRNRSSA